MTSQEYYQEELEQFHDHLENRYGKEPVATLLQQFAPELYQQLLHNFLDGNPPH